MMGKRFWGGAWVEVARWSRSRGLPTQTEPPDRYPTTGFPAPRADTHVAGRQVTNSPRLQGTIDIDIRRRPMPAPALLFPRASSARGSEGNVEGSRRLGRPQCRLLSLLILASRPRVCTHGPSTSQYTAQSACVASRDKPSGHPVPCQLLRQSRPARPALSSWITVAPHPSVGHEASRTTAGSPARPEPTRPMSAPDRLHGAPPLSWITARGTACRMRPRWAIGRHLMRLQRPTDQRDGGDLRRSPELAVRDAHPIPPVNHPAGRSRRAGEHAHPRPANRRDGRQTPYDMAAITAHMGATLQWAGIPSGNGFALPTLEDSRGMVGDRHGRQRCDSITRVPYASRSWEQGWQNGSPKFEGRYAPTKAYRPQLARPYPGKYVPNSTLRQSAERFHSWGWPCHPYREQEWAKAPHTLI
jgi:hypothetical protein